MIKIKQEKCNGSDINTQNEPSTSKTYSNSINKKHIEIKLETKVCVEDIKKESDSSDSGSGLELEKQSGSDADSDFGVKIIKKQPNDAESEDETNEETDTEDEGVATDGDLVDFDEIVQSFPRRFKLMGSRELGNNIYILHVDGTASSNPDIAIGLSDRTVQILNITNHQIARTCTTRRHDSSIVGVKFNPENENLFYATYAKESVYLYDLRTENSPVIKFLDTTVGDANDRKIISCFDVSANNRLIAVGTELHNQDAYILFWDVRKCKLMGGYWESHEEDITQVKFHPRNMNTLMSGGMDSLINLYDLNHEAEDDALVDTYNTESSVDELKWHVDGKFDVISCSSHMHTFEIWETDGSEPLARLSREVLTKSIKRQSSRFCYVIGGHSTKEGNVFVLAGSNYQEGCMRSLVFKKKNFQPYSFSSVRCGNPVIGSSWFNKNIELLVTGNEEGGLKVYDLES